MLIRLLLPKSLEPLRLFDELWLSLPLRYVFQAEKPLLSSETSSPVYFFQAEKVSCDCAITMSAFVFGVVVVVELILV